ncbi:MAG: MerR family transcriptional regulator [Bacteroidetes bacterium]|nr:MerR family transcriptional regulator [Bacteroidota bacterium]
MEIENFIPAKQFCEVYEIDLAFINSLNESGLISITVFQDVDYVEKEKIKELEKMVRLHYELEINLAGIEAISHLLKKVDTLQDEITALKIKLKLFE